MKAAAYSSKRTDLQRNGAVTGAFVGIKERGIGWNANIRNPWTPEPLDCIKIQQKTMIQCESLNADADMNANVDINIDV